jgi:hypothetical protein
MTFLINCSGSSDVEFHFSTNYNNIGNLLIVIIILSPIIAEEENNRRFHRVNYPCPNGKFESTPVLSGHWETETNRKKAKVELTFLDNDNK